MPEINQDFNLYKDSHLNIIFTFTDYDLLNSTFVWVMSDSQNNVVLTKTTPVDLYIFEGTVILSIKPEDTVNLVARQYKHELRIRDELGKTAPVSLGLVSVSPVLTASNF